MKKLVVVGQGYVGLPMAIRASQVGIDVVGLDINETTVAGLNRGYSHIDDVSNDEVMAALSRGYTATTDSGCLKDADVVIVCVPTPLGPEGGPDLRPVEDSARTIGMHAQPGLLAILESTTYPGTTEEVFAPLVLGDRFTVDEIDIAFSPERVNPGDKYFGIQNTPKVVGGLTLRATERAYEFYSKFIDEVVPAKGAREAEMAKLLENTFRHVNIALVNEMLRFCHELDIDLWDAINCAATKPFGFMPFYPGPGVGGHCIPVDPNYLSHRVKAKLGYAFRMVELAEEINHAAPLYVAERAWRLLNEQGKAVNGSTILLLGVTYKADISDLRETPAEAVADRLITLGAKISYHDPYVPAWNLHEGDISTRLESVTDPYAAAAASDLTILLQAHSQYDLSRLGRSAALLLDTRSVVSDTSNVSTL